MKSIHILLLVALTALVSACGPSKFRTYDGPEVTRILVFKEARTMYLMHHDVPLRKFDIDLGRVPVGHKQFEGDGRTPEGDYIIDRRNPNSLYHLSIGISYPEVHDTLVANEAGLSPGGDIFIHGRNGKDGGRRDWTEGCIAVTDREMEDIYAMVRDGTPIRIHP